MSSWMRECAGEKMGMRWKKAGDSTSIYTSTHNYTNMFMPPPELHPIPFPQTAHLSLS